MSSPSLSLRRAHESDEDAWDRFVEEHPQGTPFHLTGWSRAVGTGLGHETHHLIARSEGRVVGVLPMVVIRSAITGCRVVSTPLAGYGGPLAQDAETEDGLVERARSVAREIGAGHLELHFPTEEIVPAAAKNLAPSEQYASFCETLPESAVEVIDWLPAKNRRMVRLGMKAGLEGRLHRLEREPAASRATPDWLQAAHRLVATTMRNLGTPCYSIGMLRQLMAEDPQRWFVWAAYDSDGVMAGAVWVARHGNRLYPHFCGADMSYRKVGVNNFLYASLMEAGIEDGARSLDFGRSKVNSGPYHFKRHFGFEPRELGYRYDLVEAEELPSVSPANPRYALAIRLWRRLPLPVTRAIGPTLVSHFV